MIVYVLRWMQIKKRMKVRQLLTRSNFQQQEQVLQRMHQFTPEQKEQLLLESHAIRQQLRQQQQQARAIRQQLMQQQQQARQRQQVLLLQQKLLQQQQSQDELLQQSQDELLQQSQDELLQQSQDKLLQQFLDNIKQLQQHLQQYQQIFGGVMGDAVICNKTIFSNDVTAAIIEKQSISRKMAHILLQGLPESGKTSLLNRLLHKPCCVYYPSTGLCEKTVIVEIGVSSTHTSVFTCEDSNSWKVTDFGESIISQLDNCIDFFLKFTEDKATKDKATEDKITEDKATEDKATEDKVIEDKVTEDKATEDKATEDKATEDKDTEDKDKATKDKATVDKATEESSELHPGMTQKHPRLDISEPVSENVRKVLGKHNIENLADLKKTNSIYIRDTGGQVEFQESLSLLIFGPSLFIFVMKTDVDIHTKNTIQYRSSTGEMINQYKSSISTMDALIQFLTSVSAIQTTEEEVFQADGTSVCHEPAVFIVGTHIDKLGSKAQSVLTDINKTLHEMISEQKFSPFIRYADYHLRKVLYEVDNTCKDDKGFQCLRSDINQYIRDREEFLVEYPVSYLLFCLELQDINKAVISMDKCKKLAAKFCIEEEEISSLLHFLHFRVGIVQHYNVQGISDLIIKEPQVLFNKVTELILKTFLTSTFNCSTQQERFCKNGILGAASFGNLLNKKDPITSDQFLLFLIHLRVAVPFTDKSGVKQYFIPSVLNHAEKSLSDVVNPKIAPLSITFQLGHCPKGLFGMLISYLLNPEDNQEFTFDLLEDHIHQDQVSLLVSSSEDVDRICLKSHISHLEVSIDLENSCRSDLSEVYARRATSPNQVCNNVRLILHRCLQLSLKKLHYNCDKVGIGFSLKCPKQCGQFHEVKEGQKSWYIRCNTSMSKLRVPKSGRPWFNEGKVCAGIDATDNSLPIPYASSSNGSPSTSTQYSSSNAADSSIIPNFSLGHLTLLKWIDKDGQRQTLRLRDEMSSKWHDLGDLLELSPSRVNGIGCQRQGDVRLCCRDVLLDWIKDGSPQYPASWEGLLNLLEDLELGSLVEPLKSALKLS